MHRISLVLAGAACALVASAGAASAATLFCATGQHIKNGVCASDGAKAETKARDKNIEVQSWSTSQAKTAPAKVPASGSAKALTGGVHVAAGDVNGDGRAFMACANGEHIKHTSCNAGAGEAKLNSFQTGTSQAKTAAPAKTFTATVTNTNAAGAPAPSGLVKSGQGTLATSGPTAKAANTYSGATTVNAGTLSKAKAKTTSKGDGDMPK